MDFTSSIAAMSDSDADPLNLMSRREEAIHLYTAMASLPDRQKLLLLALLAHPDDGYVTISKRIGIPVGSIGPTRQRAMRRLRQHPQLVACR
jgi:DNA-directed RNA polymerase specialized sigma24 family protein